MAISQEIRDLIDATPFVDTHEHLFEESKRIKALEGANDDPIPVAAPDIGLLFSHYSESDLESAGMDPAATQRLFSYDVEPGEKWKMIEPYYRRAYHTGYLQSVRESVRALYGEDDLTAGNVDAVSERIRARIKPGFYGPILREVANLEHAQINNLDAPVFMETAQPDLLCQDMNIKTLSTDLDVETVSGLADREVADLKAWHEVIDWCFATHGPRAIAIKSAAAYRRRLDYTQVGAAEAAPLFERYLKGKDNLYRPEYKPLQDHLFNYCVRKAIEYDLPVKLHTGYYAHSGRMPLHRVRRNAGDLCELLMAHPTARFVIMHITYPYQDEAIAVAKHFPNAYVDLCWAWIINPPAAVRFVKEFLMAVPCSKLFTFGGDYLPVELVPGHARIARRGLAQAIGELVEEGWLAAGDVEDLVERLMRGNAHEVFDYRGTLAHWAWKRPSVCSTL